MAWARRKWLLEWTEDQLIQDIFDHPEFYKWILWAFADTMKEMEEWIDDTADLARLKEIEDRLEELEKDDANKKVYKKNLNYILINRKFYFRINNESAINSVIFCL